jgi:hypothetical protein
MPSDIALNAVTATGFSTEYQCCGFDNVFVQVWSAAGSNATVLIECRADVSGSPFFTAATITNPTSTGGQYYSVPPTGRVRVNVSAYVSGTITASIERNTVVTRG